MVQQPYPITTVKLANGEQVYKNDHIYVSPPWSDRDGTPYMIARIIEFLAPNSTPKKGVRNAQSNETQVRISLYYRPSDISGRNVSDFRLLLAAIHTDIQPVSNIRGKCYVRHKDRIEDLLSWKKSPDRFYFVRYFDPYIKREFEVIRTENATNIPANVREALLSRYEYLLTEKEMVADLTDAYRACCVCSEWASSQESVRCEVCKKNYHMHCLNPPLLAKPAKGYSWVCLPCSMQRHQDVQDLKYHFGGAAAASTGAGATGKASAKAVNQKKEKSVTGHRPDVMYRGWPWRYFGQYTRAQDTMDPDDQIFPRAATRVGQKYQAVVLSWEEQKEAELHHGFGEHEAGPSRHIAIERGHDIGERKHESTYEAWCTPNEDLSTYMTSVESLRLPVPPYDVERLNKAASMFTAFGATDGLQRMQNQRYEDFKPVVFTEKETNIFENELERQGGLETHETAKLLKRTPAEVLRYSYIWKNKKLKLENEALRAHHKVSTAHARKNQTLGAPSLGKMRAREGTELSDGEGSVYNEDVAAGMKLACAACSTRLSRVWWKCPRTVAGNAMCENCGTNYRKYGVISFVKSEDIKKPDKKDLLAAPKKGKASFLSALLISTRELIKAQGDTSGASTPVPPPPPKLPPCACCKRMEPKSAMARCRSCTFSAHSGCYGIAPQDMGPDWECELCLNAKQEDNHFDPRCLLCPRDSSSLISKIKSKKAPSDFDMLSALKPTEGRSWAHVLCSAWMPEIIYTNPVTMKTVEGLANLPVERWATSCSLCNQLDGAVMYCADCDIAFHPSCAWLSGYKFGFEFSLAKPGKREIVTIAKFKDGTGVMNPGCWCKSHDLEGRVVYDIHEIDPEQNETALQIYCASYKSLPQHDDTFALLRKARRLDLVTAPPPPVVEQRICAKCDVDVSPLWHRVATGAAHVNGSQSTLTRGGDDPMTGSRDGTGGEEWLCHLCHFRFEAEDAQANDEEEADIMGS